MVPFCGGGSEMFPYGIFFIPCGYCEHPIPIPRLSPLGSYADRNFRTPDEVNSNATPKKEFIRIWPVEFACMNCQRWNPYPEDDIRKLEQEHKEYEPLAKMLEKSSLWQLETIENGLPPGASKIYIVAASDILPEVLKQAVLRMVGRDGRKLDDHREIKATTPKEFRFDPI
jgi:hypothetical protein